MSTFSLNLLIFIFLATALLSFYYFRVKNFKKRLIQAVLANAIPAQATVVTLERGSFTSGSVIRKLEMKLTLEVTPSSGPAYEAYTKWVVEETAVSWIQPRQVVPVKINRHHPERIYPNAAWAEYWNWDLDELKPVKF